MTNEALANEIELKRHSLVGVRLLSEQWDTILAALRANAAPQGGQDRWNYTGRPEGGTDARKLVTLHDAHGMEWIGIRAYNHQGGFWMNNSEPEVATVHAWADLPEIAKGYWERGQLCFPETSPAAGHAEGGVGGDAFDDWMHEYLCSGRVSDSRCDPTTVLFNLNDMREAYEAGAPK